MSFDVFKKTFFSHLHHTFNIKEAIQDAKGMISTKLMHFEDEEDSKID